MKKRILFVMNNLGCGGAEKSLVTLLNCIDYSSYEVDLFLFEPEGVFMELLPPEVNLLPAPKYWKILNSSLAGSMKSLARDGRLDLMFCRGAQAIICRKFDSPERAEQYMWKFIKHAFSVLNGRYDAAIGYLEKNPVYFVVDRVKAARKIGWIHTNYSRLNINRNIEDRFFSKLDYIVTVSGECARILMNMFPGHESKVKIIENIIDPDLIRRMADMGGEAVEVEEEKEAKGANRTSITPGNPVRLVTVARLAEPKGIDLALEACRLLVRDGYKIIWRVIGDGPQRVQLESRIREYHLEYRFLLEGVKSNPYPYMKDADIYVQPSRYEGKSIAVEEAKLLCRPIVATAYGTVRDQIKDGINGLVADISPEGLYKSIKLLIDNKDLRSRLVNNLKKESVCGSREIIKLYRMIEG